MNRQNTRKTLSPAYRKHKPLRKDVNNFTDSLIACLKTIKLSDQKGESEEHIKEPIRKFLKDTFYQNNYVNTKDKIDLAIYTGKDANSDVAVIIETKRPSNKAEFLSPEHLNRKALQELLLYYLRERIDENNNNIKHLIATNGYEWFLFKSDDFYKYFYKNKDLVKEYETFRDGNKDSSKNELFYKEIAAKYIAKIEEKLPFVYLNFTKKNIKEYKDSDLNTLYKIFSDVHILGVSFGNDSNQLNKTFYNELLYIIGLEEVNEQGKKIIKRKAENKRNYASILESTIFVLEDRDYLRNIKSIENRKDIAFHAGLELSLTWINRILFLKLLESQLLSYHNSAKEYRFLNTEFIKGFDDLNDLFFSALAKKPNERHPKYKERFKHIPYLNSSLFERSELENETFTISALNDEEIEIFNQTVLKDNKGKRVKGKLKTLDYLFRFLDAYDFATDGTEGIEDAQESKTLINASVLGLIFEKINGYKEGSFYTPAYITMYMSRQALRKAIVQKFKELENNQIESFEDLQAYTARFFKKNDLKRFNKIVNSLRIVDPAVGSGHFLVSALNELISIKSELGILTDEEGLPLKCDIVIDNDELYITDSFGHLIDYKPGHKESTLIQKTLFQEKQNLIENCLFGVDINPNSVKICRLRLWIELLKNAYYTDNNQLQTLPNLDINIKQGNSLISRFDLKDDLKSAFTGKNVKYSFAEYKNAVAEYKNTNDKDRKYEILEIIKEVKQTYVKTLTSNNPKLKKLNKLKSRFYDLFSGNMMFEDSVPYGKQNKDLEKQRKIEKKKMAKEIEKLDNELNEYKNSAIYRNAFEWRFEFPEVLDNQGNYIGFDVVIGNPPYVSIQSLGKLAGYYAKFNFETYTRMGDLYALFYELAYRILKPKGISCFITGSAWMRANYGLNLRKFFINKTTPVQLIDFSDCEIFDSATVLTNIMMYEKTKNKTPVKSLRITRKQQHHIEKLSEYFEKNHILINKFPETSWIISDKKSFLIKEKVEKQGVKLIEWNINIYRGVLTGYNEAFVVSKEKKDELIAQDPKNAEILKPLLRGRDIKKYHAEFADLWLIGTFPALNIDIDKYPIIKKYLQNYMPKLKQEGISFVNKNGKQEKTRKKTANKWFETQDQIAYYKEFEKPKIIYPNMTKFLPFMLDYDEYYVNDKCFILNGDHLHYLVALFNSKLFRFCFAENFPELQGNTKEIKKFVLEQIPVKPVSEEDEQLFAKKVHKIQTLKNLNHNADTLELEAEIDQMIYKHYDLTKQEIKIIEESVQ